MSHEEQKTKTKDQNIIYSAPVSSKPEPTKAKEDQNMSNTPNSCFSLLCSIDILCFYLHLPRSALFHCEACFVQQQLYLQIYVFWAANNVSCTKQLWWTTSMPVLGRRSSCQVSLLDRFHRLYKTVASLLPKFWFAICKGKCTWYTRVS